MAEEQSKHRMKLEAYVVPSQVKQSGRGQVFGFILGVIGIGGAIYLGSLGYTKTSIGIGSVTLVSLVGVFVYGKKEQKKDLEEKQDPE